MVRGSVTEENANEGWKATFESCASFLSRFQAYCVTILVFIDLSLHLGEEGEEIRQVALRDVHSGVSQIKLKEISKAPW